MTRRLLAVAVWSAALLSAVALDMGCVGSSNGSGSGSTKPARSGEAAPATSSAPATPERSSDAKRMYPLGSLPTTTVSINDHVLRVWVAQEFDPRRPGAVEEGFMHVPREEIADDQGMLFVFSDEQIRGFWMRNTITPLDIAYARMDGTIVKICQMPPLTLRTFSSIEPALFALEVKQGTFARLGIKEGDHIDIPADAFSVSP